MNTKFLDNIIACVIGGLPVFIILVITVPPDALKPRYNPVQVQDKSIQMELDSIHREMNEMNRYLQETFGDNPNYDKKR